jgi:uncharacterized membrane protein
MKAKNLPRIKLTGILFGVAFRLDVFVVVVVVIIIIIIIMSVVGLRR